MDRLQTLNKGLSISDKVIIITKKTNKQSNKLINNK